MIYSDLMPLDDIAAAGYLKRDRVKAALEGKSVDRPPVCFWTHFAPDGSGGKMANFTVDFFVRQYDLDIAKVMADIRYPMPMQAVRSVEQWALVEDWGDHYTDFTKAYISTIKQVRSLLGPAYPLVVTVYSALTWAQLIADKRSRLPGDLALSPRLVHRALANIACNMRRHASACIEAGADGIFLSAIGCDSAIPQPIYNEIGRPYDLMILEGARNGWLNFLHVHGDDPAVRLEDVVDYPVGGISWADQTTGRSLGSMRAATSKCLIGGWNHQSPVLTDTNASFATLLEATTAQARAVVKEAGGKGLILAPGCSVPTNATHASLAAMRRSVDAL